MKKGRNPFDPKKLSPSKKRSSINIWTSRRFGVYIVKIRPIMQESSLKQKESRKVSCIYHSRRRNLLEECTWGEWAKEEVLPFLNNIHISHHKWIYMVDWQWCIQAHVRIQECIILPKREQFHLHGRFGGQLNLFDTRSWIFLFPATFKRYIACGGHYLFPKIEEEPSISFDSWR